MEAALFLSSVGYLLAVVAFMITIGFLITLLVGHVSGNETIFKVGKKGTARGESESWILENK